MSLMEINQEYCLGYYSEFVNISNWVKRTKHQCVLHLGQSQCDFFPERAAPQVRQVLFHLLQVRLAEHRRYALAVLGRPFTAEAEQQSRQTVAEHVQVRVFVVGVDACLHPAEEQESSAVLLPEIRLRRFQQEV